MRDPLRPALGLWLRFAHPEVDPGLVTLPDSTYGLRTVSSTATTGLPSVAPVPGLRLHEVPELLRGEGDGVANPWQPGHHSGLALAAFPYREAAFRCPTRSPT